MFRYMALVWDDADSEARDTAQVLGGRLQSATREWRAALKQKGLAVFHAGAQAGSSEVYVLAESSGVVLGKLFKASVDGRSASMPLAIDSAESQKISATQGRHLVDRYWGRYVAFLRDASKEITRVLRDPTAILPCHSMSLNGVQMYFAWPKDAVELAPRELAVDWQYVAAALCYARLQTHATGLKDISNVLGGECVEFHRGQITRTFYWNPLCIAETSVIENANEAAQALRSAARDCVQAWASCYSGIVHTLSGGLDSSIIMACLQDMTGAPRITCVNYHSTDSDGDERYFAHLAAERAGQQLIVRERLAEVSFEPLLAMQHLSAPPVTVLYHLENSRAEAALGAEHGATAIFSGNAGDQLFYQHNASFAAADYVVRHGLRPALFQVALDAARMDRFSVWTVLGEAIARGLLGRRWNPQDYVGKFRYLLSANAIETAKSDGRFIHPLFRAPPGHYPSGKLFHAYALLFAPDLYTPLSREGDAELVAPLYSQPLIEVLLRTPTYLLTRGGWDRATARRAFQRDMPFEIVTRQTKGGMEEHAKAIFLKNIGLIRELLADGLLVQQGILDAKNLREVLSGGPTRLGTGMVELFDYFAAEAWARRWCGGLPQRAAA